MHSRGGAALSENPLADWRSAIKSRDDLVTDPEAHRRKLVELAMLARRRNQVSAVELNEMLELSDAARLWGLIEWEEAYLNGLFSPEGTVHDDGLQKLVGKGELRQNAGEGVVTLVPHFVPIDGESSGERCFPGAPATH
jgi:hypothetical protein